MHSNKQHMELLRIFCLAVVFLFRKEILNQFGYYGLKNSFLGRME